jgi:hypothetical protein
MENAQIPDALARSRAEVTISDGRTVTVRRWSFAKAMEVTRILLEASQKLSPQGMSAAKAMNVLDFMRVFAMEAPEPLIRILRFSVADEDREKVSLESPAEDVLTLLDAVLELNRAEVLSGKVRALLARFKQ